MANDRTVLYTFLGVHVFNDFYATVMPAFLPALADEFDLDYTELGILALGATLLTGVLQPSVGHYADKFGKRRFVVAAGFLVAALGFVAMALAPTFWIIVGVSLFVGLGAATYHPQATAFLIRSYPDERGRVLGIHGIGGSIGHFMAPLAVTVVVAAINWRVAMLLIAIPLFFSALVTQNVLDESVPNPTARLAGAISRQLILAAVVFGLLSLVMRSYITFTVKMLVDEGWSETGAGTALTVILLVGAIAQPLAGRAYDVVGARSILVAACLGTIAAIALFTLASGGLSLFAIGVVAFFGFGLFPVGLAVASQLADNGQTGAAVGIIFGVSGLMAAVAQPLVGWLGESLGDIRTALSWTIIVPLLAIPLAWLINPGRIQDDTQPELEPLKTS